MKKLKGPSNPYYKPGIISNLRLANEISSRTKSKESKLAVKNMNPFLFLAVTQDEIRWECWQNGSATQTLQILQWTALDWIMLQLGHIKHGSTPSLKDFNMSSGVF